MYQRIFVPLVAAGVLVAASGCSGDDDSAAPRTADTTTTTTSVTQTTTGSDGSETDLESSQSEARSDIEVRVSDTLSDLEAEVVDGNTVITLPEQVLFEFDQYELLPDAAATLDRIAETITYFDSAPVQVNGHTDSRGSPEYNQRLSEQRAQAVVGYLTDVGVDGNRLTPQGFGETQPVASNENPDGADNPEGRAQNRRVEIVIEGVEPGDVGG